MTFADLVAHVHAVDLEVEDLVVDGQVFMIIKGVRVPAGTHDGRICEIALLRSAEDPWLPEAKVHVRPHLVAMGQRNSNPSPLGEDWQYLSRRYDRHPATPRDFFAHLLTVVGEL